MSKIIPYSYSEIQVNLPSPDFKFYIAKDIDVKLLEFKLKLLNLTLMRAKALSNHYWLIDPDLSIVESRYKAQLWDKCIDKCKAKIEEISKLLNLQNSK